eukprot:3840339-Amphidinium_carterae.1
MEWILATVATSLTGYGIKLDDDDEILFTSYADDVYVMTDSVEKLQHVIEVFQATLATFSMKLNHTKTLWCSTSHSDQAARLHLHGATLPPTPRRDGLPVLGTI